MSQPQQSLPETPETPTGRERFQFGLRSLFLVTTIVALWLGVAKLFPRPRTAAIVALLVFLHVYFIWRWIIREGHRTIGIGCIGSFMLVVIPLFALGVIDIQSSMALDSAVRWSLWGLIVAGLISAIIWFIIWIISMAARRRRLRQAKDDRSNKLPEDDAN